MSASNGNNGDGRIALLNDHKSARQTKAELERQMADNIARIATEAAVKVSEYYMQQVPQLIASMMAAAGIEVKPPPAPTDEAGTVQ
jgi:hypothetical protein